MSTPPTVPTGAVNAFAQLWAEAISAIVGQVASAAYRTQAAAEAMPEPAPSDLQLTVVASGSARGEMSLRVPGVSALQLAKLLSREPPTETPELTAQQRSAIEELFRQISGHVATAAKPRGLEIQLTTALGEMPTWSPGASGWICSGPEAPHQLQIEWKLSSALGTALVGAWLEPDIATTQNTSQPTIDAGATGAALPSKLDLLMDVELDVMLRFGGRNILLKEILELGPGAVLELDRDIQDDADLFLDGKLIARGEVVAIEGNFGLRITEVLTSQGNA